MAISVETQQFFTPHVHIAPAEGVSWNSVSAPVDKKLEWCGYQKVKKVLR